MMNITSILTPIDFSDNAGKIAKAVSNELCKAFRIPELEDAIKLCLERDVEFVSEYMEEMTW